MIDSVRRLGLIIVGKDSLNSIKSLRSGVMGGILFLALVENYIYPINSSITRDLGHFILNTVFTNVPFFFASNWLLSVSIKDTMRNKKIHDEKNLKEPMSIRRIVIPSAIIVATLLSTIKEGLLLAIKPESSSLLDYVNTSITTVLILGAGACALNYFRTRTLKS